MLDSKYQRIITTALNSAAKDQDPVPSFEWEDYSSFSEVFNGGEGSSTKAATSKTSKTPNSHESSHASSSSHAGSSSQGSSSSGGGGRTNPKSDDSEFDDYFCALMLQMSMLSQDRKTGLLGKAAEGSDAQVAIEHMLQEAQYMEQNYKLAKSLAICGTVPEEVFEEIEEQDSISVSDRELVERLLRGDNSAELSLLEANVRFHLVHQHFNTMAVCCTCMKKKMTYTAPCGHPYCDDCAQLLYSHALKNKALIPVRCCKEAFAPEIVEVCLEAADAIAKYNTMKDEIENPRPRVFDLDLAASALISENGWCVCAKCGFVIERAFGCIHMICMCKYQFCYTCNAEWKTCNCDLIPMEELNAILDERIGNEDPGIARHRLKNVLRNYYTHEHIWVREDSDGRVCGSCSSAMPLHCMYCDGCMEARCQECSFNN